MLANNGQHIGRITKVHGVHGEIVLVAENKLTKDVTKTEWVFLIIDGLPVPFRVLEASMRNENSAVLLLEGYATPEESQELLGTEAYLEHSKNKRETKPVEEVESIAGYVVIDRIRGKIGKASEIINYDGNYVMQVWQGDCEILIPVDESIILGVEDVKKEIYIQAPEGLLDLYL